LIRALNTRHVRTFSGVGRSDLEAGMLITSGGMQADASRLARRLVLSIQRIAQANDKANEMSDFAVGFAAERRVVINMRTAQAIGFSPRWQDLTDAEQLYAEVTALPSLSLLDAMHAALMDNPALAASRARLESSHDDVRIARSSLLPSLDASVARTRIDADRASPLTQAENTTAGNLTLQTTLYSERAWANYSIKRWLDEANRQGERQDMLDTLQDAATAYLDVLRAKSVEAVRRDNVENTRKNLETSRVREAVGLAERSDYLRWVAQLARDKQQLLSAEANRRQAEVELSRLMHRSIVSGYAGEVGGVH
jgi:outer membrane protein TolC